VGGYVQEAPAALQAELYALVTLLGLQAACGGSSGGSSSRAGLPAGTYQIKITGGSGAIQHSATASLAVQ